MELGSLFIILALLVLVGLFVSRPFFEPQNKNLQLSEDKEEHEVSALLAERDRILTALQELDFDATLGKIPQEDYPQQRAKLLNDGADVLRQLDTHPAYAASTSSRRKAVSEVERIEMEVAAGGTNAPAQSAAGSRGYSADGSSAGGNGSHALQVDDDLETLIANRKRERQGKSIGFCPNCGGALQKKDLFCPKCGTRTA